MSEDETLDRLRDLTNQLQKRLREAEETRGRFTKARDANHWPDLHPASSSAGDIPDLPYFRSSSADSPH